MVTIGLQLLVDDGPAACGDKGDVDGRESLQLPPPLTVTGLFCSLTYSWRPLLGLEGLLQIWVRLSDNDLMELSHDPPLLRGESILSQKYPQPQ